MMMIQFFVLTNNFVVHIILWMEIDIEYMNWFKLNVTLHLDSFTKVEKPLI